MKSKKGNKSSFVKRTPHPETLRRPPRLKSEVQKRGIQKRLKKSRGNR